MKEPYEITYARLFGDHCRVGENRTQRGKVSYFPPSLLVFYKDPWFSLLEPLTLSEKGWGGKQ